MADIFSNFWGPQQSNSTTQTLPKYNSGQTNLLDILTNQAQKGTQVGAEQYPNQMWAGINPYEASYLDSSSLRTGGAGVREAAVQAAISGKPAYDINDDTTRNYWDQYVQPEVDKQQHALNEQYAPGIFSGGRDIAQGNFSTGVLGQYANLQYQDEQARRQALTDAANRQANTAVSAYTTGLTNDQNAAALARSIEEKKLSTDYQRWVSGEADPRTGAVNQAANPYRALALQLLGISPYSYQQNVDSTGAGLGYGALSGAASGAGGAAASGVVTSLSQAFKDWYNQQGQGGEPIDYAGFDDAGYDYTDYGSPDYGY